MEASSPALIEKVQAGARIDLYNALNTSAILTCNNTFVPNGTWLQPLTVVTARMIRFSAEFTF